MKINICTALRLASNKSSLDKVTYDFDYGNEPNERKPRGCSSIWREGKHGAGHIEAHQFIGNDGG
jgi:hypothetical protein